MNIIRELSNKKESKLFVPVLAAIFVLSLSFHNHTFSLYAGPSVEISDLHTESLHSVTDCSSCLLQGNIKLPDTSAAFNLPLSDPLKLLEDTDSLLPSSYLKLKKPSRSPPVI